MISRTGEDAHKNTFNGYIRGGWVAFADAIVDLGANVNIGVDGAFASSTYFQADGVHLKDAGLTIVAGLVQTALTTLAQGTPNWLPPFGNIGIGTSTPAVNVDVRGLGNVKFNISATDTTTDSVGGFGGFSDSASVSMQAHSSARTATRFGVTIGGWAEVVNGDNGGATNGLLIGTLTNKPIILGTNSLGRLHITGAGDAGLGVPAPVCKLDVDGPARVKSYAVAGVPSAAAGAGQMIYVSNETGGAVIAFSDGTHWRRVTDRAVIS